MSGREDQPVLLFASYTETSATGGRVRYFYVPPECDGKPLRIRGISRRLNAANPPQWRITLATIDATGAAGAAYIDETYAIGTYYTEIDVLAGTLVAGMTKVTIYNVGSSLTASFLPILLECTP